MSFFNPFEYKDKSDIESEEKKQNGIFLFWGIYFRKFWKFAAVNFIYFLIMLPILLQVYLAFNGYVAGIIGEEGLNFLPGVGIYAAVAVKIPSAFMNLLTVVSIILYGPAKMGMTYMLRNFARNDHAWLSDLFSRAKANWKQGLIFGIFDFLVMAFLLNNIFGVFSGFLPIISSLRYLSLIAFVYYSFMRRYFFMLAVTVELSVFSIIKNSFIFACIELVRNMLGSTACAVIWCMCLFIYPPITFVSLPLITYSLAGFSEIFICYPVVHKYMVIPSLERETV